MGQPPNPNYTLASLTCLGCQILPHPEQSVKNIFQAQPLHYTLQEVIIMEKQINRLQNAEESLRNWTQGHNDTLKTLDILELRLICDTIRLARCEMKVKWE